jgi:rhodanese-related sulfurtransferase
MDTFISFLIDHYYLSAPLFLVIILLISSNAKKGGKRISSQELVALSNEDKALIVDLRSANDFNEGRITNSINIPFKDLDDRSHEIPSNEEKQIALICEMGSNSGNAGEQLMKLGFKDILILRGGISQWKMDNLPLI